MSRGSAGLAAFTFEDDAPCGACGYNLRGLRSDGACPECGGPIWRNARPVDRDDRGQLARQRRGRLYAAAVAASSYPLDAILLVVDAIMTPVPPSFGPQPAGRSADAAKLVDRFRAYCRQYFNDSAEAVELLTEWGIVCSEDVGRIVSALVDARLIKMPPAGVPIDFAGLFTLQTLFEPW